MGVDERVEQNELGKEKKVTRSMFAFLASNRKELREIMVEAIIELRRRGLEWKIERMEFTTWRVEDGDDGGSVCFDHGGQCHEVK